MITKFRVLNSNIHHHACRRNVYELLEEEERIGYFDSLRANMIFPKHASKEPGRVTKATMLFPSTIYSHISASGLNALRQFELRLIGLL